MIMAPTIQLYHGTRHFEDFINLFITSIVCTNKSLSSSLSADYLSFHGGIQYPLPSRGRDCHAQRIHSKPTVLHECMCLHTHADIHTCACTCELLKRSPIRAVPGTDINQIPDMLRCMLEEKARADVNQAPALCLWFCFGGLIESHFTAVCRFNELALCIKSTVYEQAAFPPRNKPPGPGEGLLMCGRLTECGRLSEIVISGA